MRETKSFDPSRTFVTGGSVRCKPRLRFVGLLCPESASGFSDPIPVPGQELIIGRQQGVGLALADEAVSRRHARIYRCEDEFVLEDLGSSNGTYVDGVPILSCVLRPGDLVQVGRSLFGFEVRLSSAPGREGMETWVE